MAEAAPLTFDDALQALAAELAREQPTARRALDRPGAGQLPNIGPLPSRQDARSAQPPRPSVVSSPLEFFRGAGERMARMTPEDQMNELGRTSDMARELTGASGLLRAGDAVGDAAIDPSIPNLTNAGVKAGAAVMRPAVVMGSLGAGYAGAAAKDLGLLDRSEADAQSLTPRQQRAMEMERQRAERDAEIARQAETNRAQLGRVDADAAQRRDLEAEATRNDRAEYDRAVTRAEDARAAELAKRRTFSDTEVGQLYDKTGGAAPFVLGAASGVAQRALNPAVSQGRIVGMGAAGGAAASNLPTFADAYIVPPVENPDQRAASGYARELPPTHPRKQEWLDYAKDEQLLPKLNPARTVAKDEFTDAWPAIKRNIGGAIEGGFGAELGQAAWGAPARLANGLASVPGKVWTALTGRPGAPATTAAPLAGTALEANGLSQRPTAGAASSADTLLSSGGGARNGLSGPSQRQLPSPEASPNQSSGLPSWASEPPAGVTLPRNTYWDANRNQPRHQDGTYVEMPKYRHPKQ